MAVLRRLDAAAVRRWCAAALVDLRARRQEIDDMNVYPVPDGDAGTNMLATMEAVDESLREAHGEDLAGTMKALARGALIGARGNSGVILSQVLSGFADVLGPVRSAGGEKIKDALDAAVSKAYAAVSHPAEGTILTVARGAAHAARAVEGDDVAAVIRAAAAGAREALESTTEQLPALKAAGVVDAGGRGLVVVLEALARVMGAGPSGTAARQEPPPLVRREATALRAARESGSPEFGYEVQFLLDAVPASVETLKRTLGQLGDSLVVVGHDGLYNVHVHVNDVGAALEAAVTAGRPHRIGVTRFDEQIERQEADRSHAAHTVVAVATAPGLQKLFTAAGAVVVADAGEAATAVSTGAGAHVVLLANSPASAAVDDHAFNDGSARVHVVPTASPVQGLAALAVHDPARTLTDDLVVMASAATSARWGSVRAAAPGEFTGSLEVDDVVHGSDAGNVAVDVVRGLLGDTRELVTLIAGAACDDAMLAKVGKLVGAIRPGLQVESHRGEQADDLLLIGVE